MERYRFELVRLGDERDETLVALEGSAELVGRMAGGLTAEAVGAERAATTVVMPSDTPVIDDGKPKRTRRTKAQIAADEAAAKLDTVQQAAAPVASVEPVAPPVPLPVAPPAAAPLATDAPYDPFASN